MKKQIWQTIASGVWEGDPFQVATFDTSSWTVPLGTVNQVVSVGLHVPTLAGISETNIKSTRDIPISTDFELTVDFDIQNVPPGAYSGLAVFTEDGNYSVMIDRWRTDNDRFDFYRSTGDNNVTTWEDGLAAPVTDMTGQMRISLIGTSLKQYQRHTSGDAWILLSTNTFAPTTPLYIRIMSEQTIASTAVDVIYSNLVILPGI